MIEIYRNFFWSRCYYCMSIVNVILVRKMFFVGFLRDGWKIPLRIFRLIYYF